MGTEQTVPQPPQLFGSVCSFTQTPLHRVKPDWHAVSVHAPPVHVCPLGHAVPQEPQWLGLFEVSVSQPLAAMPSQLAKGAVQLAT